MTTLFTADIGGTHSRFGRFEAGADGSLALIETKWVPTKSARSFSQLVGLLGAARGTLRPEDADCAVIAIAGPVERGVFSRPPFISWSIDIHRAQQALGSRRILLINDFVAQAFACRTRAGEAAGPVLPGTALPEAPIAAVGAGTSLGMAALVPDGSGGYVAVPSEGGHAEFPFQGADEQRFREFLLEQRSGAFVPALAAVSGPGLSSIHQFLTGEALGPEDVLAGLSSFSKTLEWASRFYGRVCRDFALAVAAQGGVYIAGGVAARAPALISHPSFAREFRTSPTMSDLLEGIPIFLMTDQESGLWGAAAYAMQVLRRESERRA